MTKTDKWQTRTLVTEGAQNKTRQYLWKKKSVFKSPRLGSTPRHTDWLSVVMWLWLWLWLEFDWYICSVVCFRPCTTQSQVSCELRMKGRTLRQLTISVHTGRESLQPAVFKTTSKGPYPETKLNSVAWVRERTIPTERPPLVGEVTGNFCG
jgi:hypothetical protein